jgi:type II secretory ATPase GspE/PulE/Tfp pilus assembly ATPase PilB-like protein
MMTEKDWKWLKEALRGAGYEAGELPDKDTDQELHAFLAHANGIPAGEALEWLAGVFQILPLDTMRTGCSTRAEAVFRRLATPGCEEKEAWMPIGNLGPLLIAAHYNPASAALWNIPVEFIVPVLIPQSKYESLRKDIMERLEFTPLESRVPIQLSDPLPSDKGLQRILDWLLHEYPFDDDVEVRTRLEEERQQLSPTAPADYGTLKNLSRNLGLALYHLATDEPCFQAECAPPQTLFPEALLEKHGVYPLFCGEKIVYLLSHEKNNFAFEDEWLSSGNDVLSFRTVLAEKEGIIALINRERGRAAAASTVAQQGDLTFSDVANMVDIDMQDVQRINPSSINATPEQVVHWVLYRAITGRGSDLHIEKYYNTARFRARIDGELKVIHSCTEEMLPRFISLIKNYANMGQRRQDAQDARFSLTLGKRRVDCRVSAIPCRKDLQKITIRFLDKQDGVKKFTDLNLSPRQTGLLTDAMGRDQGLVLVTGPTGSGKTTTLYALLNSINAENINIHTIEDPIEYEIEGMNQTQTDAHHGIGFSEGLRRLMRADPDVILIGECRDEETATAAINAALTGHLVLTTLHANDCLRAVSRLISMGVPPFLLADSLALSQAQRLVRRLCTFCKKPTTFSPAINRIFQANHIDIPADIPALYTKGGCPECGETGYSGRMALMEICASDHVLADMISRNAPQSEMRQLAFQKGMLTLYQEGLQQVLAGRTSLEEISCLSYTAITASEEDDDPPYGKIVGMPVDSEAALEREVAAKPQ